MKKLIYILFVLMLCGCDAESRYFPKDLNPVDLQILRFDSALLSVDTKSEAVVASVNRLYDEFPDFIGVYAEEILGIDATDTAFITEALPKYLTDTIYGFAATNARVREQFSDISDIRHTMAMAFARINYLYPELSAPEITFFVSGFNASLFFWQPHNASPNLHIAVGVDMYLGTDYEYYNRVVWNYQKQTMRKECIPADVVSAYLFHILPFTSKESRLLENMLYRGKVMYLLSLLLPDEPPYEIMGYTKEQWQWAMKNERGVWQMIVDKRDLWKSESPILTSYLNDGPFTAEISQQAPPRLGTFIGWRIAESYMQHNKDAILQQLMAEGDAQRILELSGYKP